MPVYMQPFLGIKKIQKESTSCQNTFKICLTLRLYINRKNYHSAILADLVR